MLALLVVSAFIFLTGCIPAWAGLRTFNRSWGRRFASHLFGYWLAMWVLLFENVNGAKVVFSGEKVPEKERVLIMCNHLTEVDWMYLWCLAYRKKSVGSVKYALKATVRHAPIFGWAFHCLEFLLLERKWELDKDTIRMVMTSFRDRRDPLWEVVFPEGTDFSEAKKEKSQAYARLHKLPVLEHCLLPRVKGFHACLEPLRGAIDGVYDLTVAYVPRPPTFVDNLFGLDPAEIHIDVRRIPVEDIPVKEEDASAWMYKVFQRKDEMLDHFYKKGVFPTPMIDEGGISMSQAVVGYALFTVSSLAAVWLIATSRTFLAYIVLSAIFSTSLVTLNWMPGGR
jgi:lysocardiolipin and lysophospholipid acyltransferase